jgi:hypothetical protein
MERLESAIEGASNALCLEARMELEDQGLQPPIDFPGGMANSEPEKI